MILITNFGLQPLNFFAMVLKTIRADGTNLKNAVSNSAAVKIKNLQNY